MKIFFMYRVQYKDLYYIGIHSTSREDEDPSYKGSGGKKLQTAFALHGRKNFKRTILGYYNSMQEAKEAERETVNEEMLKDPNCLNSTIGGGEFPTASGKDHPWFGRNHTAETKEKLRKANLGKKHTAETKAKIRANTSVVSVCVGDTWYDSMTEASMNEDISISTLSLAYKNNRTTAKNKNGKVFTLKYK